MNYLFGAVKAASPMKTVSVRRDTVREQTAARCPDNAVTAGAATADDSFTLLNTAKRQGTGPLTDVTGTTCLLDNVSKVLASLRCCPL
jgi:hypothetical protein